MEVLDCQCKDYQTRRSLRVAFHPSRLMHVQRARCSVQWLESKLEDRL